MANPGDTTGDLKAQPCIYCIPKPCAYHQVALDVAKLTAEELEADGGKGWTAEMEIAYRRNVADMWPGRDA